MHIGIRRSMECWLMQKLINRSSEMIIERKRGQPRIYGGEYERV